MPEVQSSALGKWEKKMKLRITETWGEVFLDYKVHKNWGSILVLSKRGVEKLYTYGEDSLFRRRGYIVDED